MEEAVAGKEVDVLHSKEQLEEMQRLPLPRKIQITTARIIEWYLCGLFWRQGLDRTP